MDIKLSYVYVMTNKTKSVLYYRRDINLAIARETQLKLWRREKKERLINLVNPRWDIVADEKRIIIELKPKIIMPKR